LVEFVAHFKEGLLDRKLKFRRMGLAINTLDVRDIVAIIEIKKSQAERSQIGMLGRIMKIAFAVARI